MKKTLKLIPAIVMLLVSAILVSTATYAWFSMSTTVTAQNMSIKATTDGTLLISKDDASWSTAGTSIDFQLDTTGEAVAVIPTSVIPGAAATNWYTTGGTSATNGTKAADANYTALATTNFSTNNGAYQNGGKTYALHEEFYLQSPSGQLTNVGLQKVDFSKLNTSGNDDIEQAILVRVVFAEMIDGDTTDSDESKDDIDYDHAVYVTWAKDRDGSAVTYVTGTATGNTSTGYALVDKGAADQTLVKNASDSVTHVIATFKANTSYHVDVYIYLNGEHAKCTSYNATGWLGSTFSLTFNAGMTYANIA